MNARPEAEDAIVFRGQNGLWITLAVLAGLAGVLTLFVAGSSLPEGGPGAALGATLKGGAIAAALAGGAWVAARGRREVVLDREGVTVRVPGGAARLRLGWREIARIESRPLPSQPLRPAVVFHRADGVAFLIDPQQVGDTATLAREAERRWSAARGAWGREWGRRER